MVTQVDREQDIPKAPKLLACKRCRHRKQKCTRIRPCENCVQSGVECIPFGHLEPSLEQGYVQRLEERVAQLESLFPQESLDHINASLAAPEIMSHPMRGDHNAIPRTETSSASSPAILVQSSSSPDRAVDINLTAEKSPKWQNQGYNGTSPSQLLENTSSDVLSSGLFVALSSMHHHIQQTVPNEGRIEAPDLGQNTEQFLIETYFDMAHSQYPFLLKHHFMEWSSSWGDGKDTPSESRWKGFFIYMVYAIAFLMTKSRIDGPTKSQALYDLACSEYLPYLLSTPSALTRAQGFLLLTVYALHMPSQETIISLSSTTLRFCVMSQLHLAETEPEALNNDAFVQIQHRRRVFWCAYAIDRAVCSSYHLPASIPDNHITVEMFDNIDDDQLLGAGLSNPDGARDSPTSVSSALHVFFSRQLESEIQETVLNKNFVSQSEEAFLWRARVREKVEAWNARSTRSSEPARKGYVSQRWLKLMYYYNIVMLYRPTRDIVQGIAGDLSVQACCQALLLFRKFQMAKEIAQPWLGLLTQFQIGVTLLYCFYATPTAHWKPSYKSADVPDAIRACSNTLAVLAERWPEAECVRDVFEILAKEVPIGAMWERPKRISEAGRNALDENWEKMSKTVVHRPTLGMIREMAAEDFAEQDPMESDGEIADATHVATTAISEHASMTMDGMDLPWSAHVDAFEDEMCFGT